MPTKFKILPEGGCEVRSTVPTRELEWLFQEEQAATQCGGRVLDRANFSGFQAYLAGTAPSMEKRIREETDAYLRLIAQNYLSEQHG